MSSPRRATPRGQAAKLGRPLARRALALREDGGLRLVVIADTHSNPHPRSVELAASLAPDAILHAGDIGDLGVLDRFEAVAQVLAVRGNIDGHVLPDTLIVELTRAAAPVFSLLLTHIAVYGPRLRAEVRASADREGAGLVVCGHSHVPFISRDRGLGVFNPGSIGPRRFQLPITLGVIEVKPDGVSLRHMSCETGETWTP